MILRANAPLASVSIRPVRYLALFSLWICSGCVSLSDDASRIDGEAIAVEVQATPFYPQKRYQCGPAALATILTFSGAPVSLVELTEQVFLPARNGSLQPELLAATRAAGRMPYRIDGTLGSLYAELEAGRPVLILQNLGIKILPRWHYAVVVGVNPGQQEIYLRSGTDERRTTGFRPFLNTWRRSGFWAIVSLRPGELPADPDAFRYFESVAALESTGHPGASRAGWETAYSTWPDEPVAIFGLGNAEYAASEFIRAESLYQELLDLKPRELLAGNNLALALMEQGKYEAAMDRIEWVLDNAEPGNPLLHEFELSRQQIARAAAHRPNLPAR